MKPAYPLDLKTLKEKQRALRDGFSLPLTLRVHRALSWLLRANREEDDFDTRFIMLWIGFNAAYAGDLERALDEDGGRRRPGATSERERFDGFFRDLVRLDTEGRLYKALWTRFPQEIRILLDNRFVFAPFWKHHAGLPGGAGWEITFEASKRAAHAALAAGDTPVVLSILFDRLYVLRNQLLHGGATWNSGQSGAGPRRGRYPRPPVAVVHRSDDGQPGRGMGDAAVSGDRGMNDRFCRVAIVGNLA